jgi:ribonuclease VapC
MTLFDASMVMSRHRSDGYTDVTDLLASIRASIEPFTGADAALAHDAFVRFGRGSGHPARLNFGDCAAYALSKRLGLPLLYKGADFAATDV